MILYNITVIVEEEIEQEWLGWMQNSQIPAVMEAGKFVSYRLLRVLESPNEGVTFCVQYIADSKEIYNEYRERFEEQFLHAMQTKYLNQLVSFSTIMEFI